MEGVLNRKHEWESTTKRSSNRSWDKIYVVLKKDKLMFYKDQKHVKNDPESYYKGEPVINLKDVIVEIASNYTKKKHVFRLKLPNGAEYLFQAKDDAEMEFWLQKFNLAMEPQAPSPSQSRSQTMPAKGSSLERKEQELKKRGIFTMKKK
ncbi:beta chain spectrin-like protein [Sarcoptes scabiei]|nr:beta chain spectrin-like protein [Sarcoptes scabiei]